MHESREKKMKSHTAIIDHRWLSKLKLIEKKIGFLSQ